MRAALAAGLAAAPAPAATAAGAALVPSATFSQPVHVAAPPGTRRACSWSSGRPRAARRRRQHADAFLDLTARSRRRRRAGLLSIAFPPDYAASGRFYVFSTARPARSPSARPATSCAEAAARRRTASVAGAGSASSPHPAPGATTTTAASSRSAPTARSTPAPATAAARRPRDDAQDPDSLLGKILRIDRPRRGSAAPAVWALGLRNPWRFSFDRAHRRHADRRRRRARARRSTRPPAARPRRATTAGRCEGDAARLRGPALPAPAVHAAARATGTPRDRRLRGARPGPAVAARAATSSPT